MANYYTTEHVIEILNIKTESLWFLNKNLELNKHYQYGFSSAGQRTRKFYNDLGIQKLKSNKQKLEATKKKTYEIYKELSGYDNIAIRKNKAVLTRFGIVEYFRNKLNKEEISYLLDRDRATIYRTVRVLENDLKYYPENELEIINKAKEYCERVNLGELEWKAN